MTQHWMLAWKLCEFHGIRTSIDKKPYSLWFSGGWGGLDPLSSLWIRAWFAYRIMFYQSLNKNEKYHPTTTKTGMSCRIYRSCCSGGPAGVHRIAWCSNGSARTSMSIQLCFGLLKSPYDRSPVKSPFHLEITNDRSSHVMAFPWSRDSAGI